MDSQIKNNLGSLTTHFPFGLSIRSAPCLSAPLFLISLLVKQTAGHSGFQRTGQVRTLRVDHSSTRCQLWTLLSHKLNSLLRE